jgi:hypothetical protein
MFSGTYGLLEEFSEVSRSLRLSGWFEDEARNHQELLQVLYSRCHS